MEKYTPEEVEQYTTEVKDICAKYKSYGMIFKKKSYLKDFVEWKTSAHLSYPFYTFRTKLYWIVHDLTDFPRCKNPECNKPLEWKNIDSVARGYCDYCSYSCAMKSEETQKTMRDNFKKVHGVDCWGQLPEAKEHLRQIWRNKTQEEIDERTRKTKTTLKERYGDENYNNIELTQLHDRLNHGGVLYRQTHECHQNRRKRYVHDGIQFDSSWEICVYDYCKVNGIKCEYQPNVSFIYEYGNKKWVYQPDFLINGKVYEVKGDQFFRFNETTGKEEMYNPYRNKNWSDEQYEMVCGKFEAKHQCMIANNVTILRNREIHNLNEVFNNGYS